MTYTYKQSEDLTHYSILCDGVIIATTHLKEYALLLVSGMNRKYDWDASKSMLDERLTHFEKEFEQAFRKHILGEE